MDSENDTLCWDMLALLVEREIGRGDLYDDIEGEVARESHRALCRIKAVLEDKALSDFDCIERIVNVFENIGSDCGTRHDFGRERFDNLPR